MSNYKFQAIKRLRPDSLFKVYGDGVVEWSDENTTEEPTQAEIDAVLGDVQLEVKSQEIRVQRDRLLTESDWVTIRATERGDPVPTEWQTYRQALRDIPDQTGFPEEIEWPQEPES